VSHPAMFAEPREGGALRCTLCPHLCVIQEGAEGLCRARGVRDGSLRSLVYGRPATVVSDEIEKKPLYHFHPGTRALSLGTLGCNVLCAGCPNWQISHAGAGRGEAEKLAELTPARALALARRSKLQGIAWTYNDPVVWAEYVHDTAVVFKRAGLYTAFISAGYMTTEAVDYLAPVLDAFKFDLKAPSAAGWARLGKVRDPAPALAAAVRAKEMHGCHVEVVSNIVPGINDDEASLHAMAAWVCRALGPATPWHVTRFLPEFELSYLPPTPIATLENAAGIGRHEGLQFVYVGNVAGHATRNTVCPGCSRTVIRREARGAEQLELVGGLCAFCGTDLNVVR
jgi:pyruvate formate lyase activating enzyme